MCGKYVFHGSPIRINGDLRPNLNIRASPTTIIYEGISLHATRLLYISLTYLGSRAGNHLRGKEFFGTAVDLNAADNTLVWRGPPSMSLPDVFHLLFGKGGYVYVLPADRFSTVKGLGPLEIVSFDSVKPLRRIRLSEIELSAMFKLLGTHIVRGK